MAFIENEEILAQLKKIEEDNNVKILFACEAGSRAWGFESPDSDYDVRFIYVPRLQYYLDVHVPGQPATMNHRDVIETPISGDLDITGWEIRKALRLAMGSNPALLEWLDSPKVYLTTPKMVQFREIALDCMTASKLYHHYYGMAKRNYHEHLTGDTVRYKKYLYVIRPLLACRWVSAFLKGGEQYCYHNTTTMGLMPPVDFRKLMRHTVIENTPIHREIQQLLKIKTTAEEAESSSPWPLLQEFILRELEAAKQEIRSVVYQQPKHDINGYMLQTVLEAHTSQRR
jgi:predicted nucleotidyltransferase